MHSSILSNNTSSEQDWEGQNKKNSFDNILLAETDLVLPNIEHVNQ